MADEKNKKDQPSVESLQTQIRQLEKLVLRVPSKYLVDGIDESQSSLLDGDQMDLFEE